MLTWKCYEMHAQILGLTEDLQVLVVWVLRIAKTGEVPSVQTLLVVLLCAEPSDIQCFLFTRDEDSRARTLFDSARRAILLFDLDISLH